MGWRVAGWIGGSRGFLKSGWMLYHLLGIFFFDKVITFSLRMVGLLSIKINHHDEIFVFNKHPFGVVQGKNCIK
jgi:hypothetical protein